MGKSNILGLNLVNAHILSGHGLHQHLLFDDESHLARSWRDAIHGLHGNDESISCDWIRLNRTSFAAI